MLFGINCFWMLNNYHEFWVKTPMLIYENPMKIGLFLISKIKQKQTKRLSPYTENDLLERDELLFIVKYESINRNKAIIYRLA